MEAALAATRRCSSPRSAATSRGPRVRARTRATPLADADVVVRRGSRTSGSRPPRSRATRSWSTPQGERRRLGVRRDPAAAPGARPAREVHRPRRRSRCASWSPHVGGAFGGKAGHRLHPRRDRRRRPGARPAGGLDRDPQRGDALDARPRAGAVRRARPHPRRAHRRAAGPQDRRLRRLRRLRRRARGRADPHHGPGPLRDPEDRLRRHRRDHQHRPERRVPRRRPARGGRDAGAADGPGRRRAGLAPEEIRRRNLLATDAFPYTTRTGVQLRRRRLHGSPSTRRCGSPTSTSARAEQQRRREAGDPVQLGHRRLDVRRDHRLRRHRARQRRRSSPTAPRR